MKLIKFLVTGLGFIFLSCNQSSEFGPVTDLSNPFLPTIRFAPNPGRETDYTNGHPEKIADLYMILTDGRAFRVDSRLQFRNDTFLLTPGQRLGPGLEFEFRIYNTTDTFRQRFKTPETKQAEGWASVQSISPESDSIPANILLFHIYFDQEMEENPSAYRFVNLVDENGKTSQFVWREKAGWSDNGRQLTLMIHPGRIKRGIEYAEEHGAVFVPGKTYSLVLDSGLRSKSGQALGISRKTYFITPEDREIPVLKGLVKSPTAGTHEPIVVRFSESMDRGTLEPGIRIFNTQGQLVQGTVIRGNMSLWQFKPTDPWPDEEIVIELNDYCTDLSGNHLHRKFEVTRIDEIRHDGKETIRFKPLRP